MIISILIPPSTSVFPEAIVYLNHRTWRNQAALALRLHPYWLAFRMLEGATTHDATGETGHRQSDSDVSPVNYKVTSLTGYVYWYNGGINVMAATLRMELRPALRDGTHLWHH